MDSGMFKRLIPDPFIAALVTVALVAILLPARGVFVPFVDTLANLLIVALFFLHGVKLSRQALAGALVHWRLHLSILTATFLLFPLIGLGLSRLLPGLMLPGLWTGLLFVCALPSTVQSSVAFTAIARGNVAGAVTAAAASNMAGIVLTPLIVSLILHAGKAAPISGIGRIAMLLLLPFIIGHLLRPWLGDWVERQLRWVRLNDRATVLVAVYGAFSAATVAGLWQLLSPMAFLGVLLASAILLALVMVIIQLSARLCGFSLEDRIAIQFAGSKKSLVSGIPMARILFAGPELGLVTIPLMLFHQLQLMVCAELARRWSMRP
jgi:solute carrier family 10 (sodium/bile acid cotransporter), member 7